MRRYILTEFQKFSLIKEVKVTHRYSKDKKNDLKQIVVEMIVSSDEGVPIVFKAWDGNASDSAIFRHHCEELLEWIKSSNAPEVVIAYSKLYSSDNIENLTILPFLTRILSTVKEVNQIAERGVLQSSE